MGCVSRLMMATGLWCWWGGMDGAGFTGAGCAQTLQEAQSLVTRASAVTGVLAALFVLVVVLLGATFVMFKQVGHHWAGLGWAPPQREGGRVLKPACVLLVVACLMMIR